MPKASKVTLTSQQEALASEIANKAAEQIASKVPSEVEWRLVVTLCAKIMLAEVKA